tara:strand:+ start:370 stop:1503 length:1134 start_codon:yes stop_codon:yes gene_type:complete
MKKIQFSTLEFSHVFKSSEKYIIGIVNNQSGESFVLKISNKNNEELNKEINRISELRSQYDFMRERLGPVADHGVFEKGYHKGKCYYLYPLIDGDTFSHFVQKPSIDHSKIEKIFKLICTETLRFCREHKFDSRYDQSSGSFIKSLIKQSIDKLNDFLSVRALLELGNLTINKCKETNIKEVVYQILDHSAVKKLDELNSFVSEVGHWNFHGDNLIIKDLSSPNSFSVIDPDIHIDTCDSLFTLARFLYTYPHDTADYSQYVIESNYLFPNKDDNCYFNIKTLWPQVVSQLYSELFDPFLDQASFRINRIIPDIGDDELLRLQLNYLLCLLRGITANYESKFTIPSNNLSFFQNKGIFLYLTAVIFANNMRDKLYGN